MSVRAATSLLWHEVGLTGTTSHEFSEQIAESQEHAQWFQQALLKAEKRFAALAKVEERHANHYKQVLAAVQA